MFETELNTLHRLYQSGLFSKPYYRDRIPGPAAFNSYEAFCCIPFMTKESIRETPVFERTNTKMEDVYGVFSSSGTTGTKTFYIYNRNDKVVHEEFVRAFFQPLGVTEQDLGAVMAPVGTGVMGHTMLWEFATMGAGYVNCPEPSPQNMIDIVENVPVTVIATRPNIASTVAYDTEWTRKAQSSHVRTLALGGGFLSAQRRALLERVWDAQCYNFFGMSEMFGPMAAECREKNGQHYLDKYLMIELVDPVTGKPVPPGQPGIAVYTTLWEKGFPLLRYWTDDLMRIETAPCPCGSPLPRLFYLGRLADHFMVEGSYVFPEQVENILFAAGYIGEYKAVCREGGYTVRTEGGSPGGAEAVRQQLEALLKAPVTFELVAPGSLGYKGVGNRFAHG